VMLHLHSARHRATPLAAPTDDVRVERAAPSTPSSWRRRAGRRMARLGWIWLLVAVMVSWCIPAIGQGLSVRFPGDLDLGVLAIGDNASGLQVLSVESDVGYSVYVRADRERLGQWDSRYAAYVAGIEMVEPLILVSESGAFALGMGDVLIADRPGPSPSPDVSFWFLQRVGFDDRPAPGGRAYRILLTYTVVQDV
jgi:hypothetical protein